MNGYNLIQTTKHIDAWTENKMTNESEASIYNQKNIGRVKTVLKINLKTSGLF